MTARTAVFLDRDGVLNDLVDRDGRLVSPRCIDDFRIVPGAGSAVARLRDAGLLVFVVTNQPDISRGLMTATQLAAMLDLVRAEIPVHDVRVCPHDDADGCDCRKPLPGLLTQLQADWQLRPDGCYMVGDSWRDMSAGRAAGCRTVLLRRAYNADAKGDTEVEALDGAVDWILERERMMAAGSARSARAGAVS